MCPVGSEPAHVVTGEEHQHATVVVATDRRCLWGCAVAGRSLIENGRPGGTIDFYLLHSGLSSTDLERVERSWTTPARNVRTLAIPFSIGRVGDLLRTKHVTHMAYARLFLAELLPSHIDKCVYIDTDILFELDVFELLHTPLDGCAVGAVPNGDDRDGARQFRRLGIQGRRYFNSGVVLIDLDRWRARRIGEAALRFSREFVGPLIMGDQDALNAVLHDDWKVLPERWNTWASWIQDDEPRVTHFTMVPKPWHADYTGPLRDRFFAYLDRTAFAGRRPRNPLGLGPLVARVGRKVPYWPTVLRLVRERLNRGKVG